MTAETPEPAPEPSETPEAEAPGLPLEARSTLEYVEAANGEWYWRHKARNGEQLSRSSETYKARRDAEHGAAVSLGADRVSTMVTKVLRHKRT